MADLPWCGEGVRVCGVRQFSSAALAGRETTYVWTGTRAPRGQMPAATRKKKGSPAAADSAEAVSEETAPAPEGAEEEIVETELEVSGVTLEVIQLAAAQAAQAKAQESAAAAAEQVKAAKAAKDAAEAEPVSLVASSAGGGWPIKPALFRRRKWRDHAAQGGGVKNEQDIDAMMKYLRDHG